MVEAQQQVDLERDNKLLEDLTEDLHLSSLMGKNSEDAGTWSVVILSGHFRPYRKLLHTLVRSRDSLLLNVPHLPHGVGPASGLRW